ncbi:rhodanese-like domain-containing protein [Schaalia vaccimaxillae]|uniref:rhodanese-like domain-containing protein n=1 Tax=Schaalia vaccimaxillae TaxID=183916 RepID=UPI0003B4B5DB|nr:rhodanese-like domain-containing protein [Schaalia vaccimaxillae]
MAKSLTRVFTSLTLGVLIVGSMSACTTNSSADSTPGATQSASSSSMTAEELGTLIDVRTPEEFAQGHLEGAINIDFNSADFQEQITQLDPNGTYTLYCRSGNRAGQALELMKNQGFNQVTNIGGVEEAAATTGLEIVTD